MKSAIKYLRREDIDIVKWDDCVRNSNNGLCYAESLFLDIMSTNWDALIMGEYEAVMPLPFRKKYGISYLYQPAFTQQLGVISSGPKDLSDLFLQHIPATFKYWDFRLNFLNRCTAFNAHLRKNYLLSLSPDYETLSALYSRNAIRNIKTAIAHNITIEENIQPRSVIDLHIQRFGNTDGILLLGNYLSQIKTYSVAARFEDQYVGSSVYIMYKNRLTFILNGNREKNLSLGATHLLKDHVIKKFAGSEYILDFEGSENPDFARFYEQFGAKEIEYYPHLIVNKLPWPLKLFK